QRKLLNFARILCDAIHRCTPDLLMTNDEVLTKNLLTLRRKLRTSEDLGNELHPLLLPLLEKSFLADDQFYSRENSLTLAAKSGFPVPDGAIVTNWSDLEKSARAFGYPFFLKVSFEGAGEGVAHISSPTALSVTATRLANTGIHLDERYPALLQKPVEGVELTVNFSAWNGELLAFDVFKPLERREKTGPASVLQSMYRPHYEEAVQTLVKSLEYTGFGGIDAFETTSSGLPTAIEINLRPTSSLSVAKQINSPIIKRFSGCLTNNRPTDTQASHSRLDQTIALFPDEYLRDNNSPYMSKYLVNAPWNDPGLMRYLLKVAGLSNG
ncbi:MAG: hypothetical protein ABJN51_14070, partial [Sneathiella sp.]